VDAANEDDEEEEWWWWWWWWWEEDAGPLPLRFGIAMAVDEEDDMVGWELLCR